MLAKLKKAYDDGEHGDGVAAKLKQAYDDGEHGDGVAGKLKQAYDDGEHGDGVAGKKIALFTSQVKAVAAKLGLVGEYESKLDKLMKVEGTAMIEGLFASTEPGFLQAISGEVKSGKTFILLKWPEMKGVESFNLYRVQVPSKGSIVTPKPINAKPIAVMSDCNDIKKIIPTTSVEWQAISNILSGASETTKKSSSSTKGGTVKSSSVSPISPVSPKKGAYVDEIVAPVSLAKLSGPCNVSNVSATSETYSELMALSSRYWKVGVVMGHSYVDSNVIVGKKYMYAIAPAKSAKGLGLGEELKPIDTATVVAGTVKPLPPPSGVTTIAGDCKVMIRWNEIGPASGYDVYRKAPLSSIWEKINGAEIMEKCTLDLDGNKIPEMLCFRDFMRWDSAGYPTKHEVVSPDSTYGPINNFPYSYKVRALNALGYEGMFSAAVSATPQDATPPAAPYGITVEAYPDGLQPKWYQVSHDELGHVELFGIQGYRVYRFNTADSLGDSVLIASMVPDTFGTFPLFKDTDPAIFSAYGEKTYWYRVRCVDKKGNISGFSPSAGNNLPDTTPPKRPIDLVAESHADHIALKWKKPGTVPPDLAGYNIYRGICGGDSVCVEYEKPNVTTHVPTGGTICTAWEWRPYPTHLVGNNDHPDSLEYKDFTVPAGSPICYRYTIKAYDRSQNLSDTSKSVCQKLREETPPAPPVLAGLKARDRSVKVEWVSSPVQDLFGFMVYRAEKEAGPYKRVSDTLITPEKVDCDDIPATNVWAADSVFSFIDTTVVEKKVYWYRVKGVDYLGNIGDPSIAIETYTYNIGPPPTPTDLKVTQPSGKCALLIEWKPSYDTEYAGFVVFRSSDPSKDYRQVSPIVKDNKYLDNTVIGDRDYYYKVQYFAKNGNRSLVSTVKNGKATP
jgi:hypothetical protein